MINKYQFNNIGAKLKSIALPIFILMSSAVANPALAADWSLPWQAGKSAPVNGSFHTNWDGLPGDNALDFGLAADETVLVPVDNSTVKRFCNAGNNHYSVLFSSPDGDYSMSHFTRTSGFQQGQVFRKGQTLGVVARDKPWNNCAQSTGSHIHLGFPSRNLVVDGYRVQNMIGQRLTSRNQQIIIPPTDVNLVNFSAVTYPAGVNVRSGASTSAQVVRTIAGNVRVNFDGWKYGDSVIDVATRRGDRRWYRIAGTNNWIASAVVNGNAPGSQP